MRTGKIKAGILAVLALIALTAVTAGVCLFKTSAFAAEEQKVYNESYRNKLAYSPYRGWNNDPNGLLYADGVYHMYYQYNQNAEYLDEHTGDEEYKRKANEWGNICWAHATSSDLVNWEQQGVAISANQTVGDNFYALLFSGSAVYDEHNTSGLFEGDKGGIVAVMTQPCWNAELGHDVQRQVLAYSTDGNDFIIYGEILAFNEDGGLGDNEFRDPKVFWNEKLNKWLMVVGGGSVRMYSSDNLIKWDYLGETGFWGECPDLSRYEVNGEEMYALIVSPEDKIKSHNYNGTNRVNTYYPSEYYTVGELDENGLFRSVQPLKRLSEGIDSYAFQSFNNAPDGKVYGISWSASWLTVGEYASFRKNYNGGMTVACELRIEEENGEYILKRMPVEGFESLRGEKTEINGRQEAGKNIFAGVKATEADIEAELDFTGSTATFAQLNLRVSDVERIILRYDIGSETLTLDRSQSSLIAQDTKFFKNVYGKKVPLIENKLNLRILLDRAFISVFANDGYASYFSAVFPSALSNGIRFLSDGDIFVKANIYSVNGIFGDAESVNELILTTNKIDMTVGGAYPVIASSYGFDAGDVKFEVTEGAENVAVEKINGVAYIKALKKGSAIIEVHGQKIEVYIYENALQSNVKFTDRYRGFSFIREDGLFFEAGAEDAFLFGDACANDFTYSAYFTPLNDAKAGGLVIGYNGNPSGFWFVTADIKENRVKLVEFKGEKEAPELIRSVKYEFEGRERYKLAVTVCGGEIKAFVNDESTAVIISRLPNYAGGRVGLNIFNSQMAINRIVFKPTVTADGNFNTGGYEVIKVVNVTDFSYRLQDGEYSVENGKLLISGDYLLTLEADTEYIFRVVTSFTEYDIKVKTDFTPSNVTPLKDEYLKGDKLTLAVSSGTQVYKVEINGKECPFTQANDIITIGAEQLEPLTGGTHTVKVFTAKGRVSANFTVSGLEDFREEQIEIISHTFFYIDIAIFATLIIAYFAFKIFGKMFRKKEANAAADGKTGKDSKDVIGQDNKDTKESMKECPAVTMQASSEVVCKSSTGRRERNSAEKKVKRKRNGAGLKRLAREIDLKLIVCLISALVCYVIFTVICSNSAFSDGGFYGALLFLIPLIVFGSIHSLFDFISSFKSDADGETDGYSRNLSLITGAVFAAVNLVCFLALYLSTKENFYVILLVLGTVLSFTFVSQFMWGGAIQDIFTAGGFTFKLPGFIFSLTLDSILWMIITKIFLGIAAVLVFIVSAVFLTLVAVLGSVFTFIPSVIAKSVKDKNV